MKTTKKLAVLGLAAVLAAISFIPSTFSWYTHSGTEEGNYLQYTRDDLPVSMKSSVNSVSAITYKCDANGEKGDEAAKIVLPPDGGKAVQYYLTELTNTGNSDVMVDLQTSKLKNNADFVIGTVSPTINEKAYASRATRSKKAGASTRVYFRTKNAFNPYWTHFNNNADNAAASALEVEVDYTAVDSNGKKTIKNDYNIAYKLTGSESEVYMPMKRCPKKIDGTAANWDESHAEDYVFYCDIPSNAEYFYFFNHWYIVSSTNKDWNSTLHFTDTTTQGRLFYMTGVTNDKNNKECKAADVDTGLAAVNSYYDSVRMSTGGSVYADIGLKKESDDANFIPEYYGSSISYAVTSGDLVVTVNNDGLVSPLDTGVAEVTTTITGKYGDSIQTVTAIDIPGEIAQVPILENIKVAKSGAKDDMGNSLDKVTILWYALNKSKTRPPDQLTDDYPALMTTNQIFITI